MADKTFIRITNQNIYDKLTKIEEHLLKMNGSVANNTKNISRIWWALGILFSLSITVVIALK